MTPEVQRHAIHRALGWTPEDGSMNYDGWLMPWRVWTRAGEKVGDDWMPDYLNDLNACFSMEEVLTEDDQEMFAYELSQIVPQRLNCGPALGDEDIMVHRDFDVLHATAAQRCEAFLRALNLWRKEE